MIGMSFHLNISLFLMKSCRLSFNELKNAIKNVEYKRHFLQFRLWIGQFRNSFAMFLGQDLESTKSWPPSMYISNFQILERSWSRGCHIAVDMFDQQSFLWLGSFEWKLCSLFHTIMAMQLKRQLNHKLLTEDSWVVTSHSCCSSWSWWRRESLGWGDPGRGSRRGRGGCSRLLSSPRREDPSWRWRQHPPVDGKFKMKWDAETGLFVLTRRLG